MSRASAISFALNLGSFCLLLAFAAFAWSPLDLGNADEVLHDTYYVVAFPTIFALFGGAVALLAAGLIVQIRTLKKGGQ